MSDALDLHPDAAILEPLLGRWKGRGAGEYPTIEPFEYTELVSFGHNGKPLVAYTQRTKDAVSGNPLHAESGYWRPTQIAPPVEHVPMRGLIEVVMAHPFGATEISEGTVVSTPTGVMIDVRSTAIAVTSTAKSVTQVERTVTVDGDTLHYTVRMAAVGQPLLHHLAATLTRM